jgi:hypothetical protein
VGKRGPGALDAWLRRQAFDLPARQAAFESAYEAVALTSGRRDRLDAAIEAMAADSESRAFWWNAGRRYDLRVDLGPSVVRWFDMTPP